ncbi:MAG: GAK system XXXCH domain-containing protein [Desulfohalobiaceae bacterium]
MEKQKTESFHELTPRQAGEYLRNVAQALEEGHLGLEDLDLDWQQIHKLELKLVNRAGEIGLKTKVKPWVQDSGKKRKKDSVKSSQAGDKGRPFKALKKEMEKTFKAIRSSVQDGASPSLKEAQDLHSQAEEMQQKAGRNQEGYSAFLELTAGFVKSAEEGDLGRAGRLIQDMRQAEKDCHARFK